MSPDTQSSRLIHSGSYRIWVGVLAVIHRYRVGARTVLSVRTDGSECPMAQVTAFVGGIGTGGDGEASVPRQNCADRRCRRNGDVERARVGVAAVVHVGRAKRKRTCRA